MANPAIPRLSSLRFPPLLPLCSPFHPSKSFVPKGRNRGFSCCSELPLPIKQAPLIRNPVHDLNGDMMNNSFNCCRSELCLSFGSHLIPHPAKVDRGGEDAFFVNSYNGGVLAVADGVSGWAAQDVNPALFSRELMAKAEALLTDEEVNCDPQVLMRKAHSATSSVGSATVKEKIIFATSPQEHYFDCPYQLSSTTNGQTYKDATVCVVELMEGDIIVVGSDGLFDNVFDQEILSTISKYEDVTEAAKDLAELANSHSKDVDFDSPYAVEARSKGFDIPWWKKILGKRLTGGKLDDITVVVGRVMCSSNDQMEMLTAQLVMS